MRGKWWCLSCKPCDLESTAQALLLCLAVNTSSNYRRLFPAFPHESRNFPVPCRVRPALLHSREKENFADYPGSVGQAAGHTITPVLALPHLPSCLPASQGFLGPSPQSGDSYPQMWGSGLVWLPHAVRLGKSRACVALTTAGFWRGHEDGCWCLGCQGFSETCLHGQSLSRGPSLAQGWLSAPSRQLGAKAVSCH